MSEPNGSLTSTELQRVKVYRLNAEGHWDDKGQGQVTIEFLEVGCTSAISYQLSAADQSAAAVDAADVSLCRLLSALPDH